MKTKILIYSIFLARLKDRKNVWFYWFGELGLMPKVSKPIRQTEEETLELKRIILIA